MGTSKKIRLCGHHYDKPQWVNEEEAFEVFKKYWKPSKNYYGVNFCTRYSFLQKSDLVYCTLNNKRHEVLALNTEYIYYRYPTGSIELLQFPNAGEAIKFFKRLTHNRNYKLHLKQGVTEFPEFYIGTVVARKKATTINLQKIDQSLHKEFYYYNNKKTLTAKVKVTPSDKFTVFSVFNEYKTLNDFVKGKWIKVPTNHEGDLVYTFYNKEKNIIPVVEEIDGKDYKSLWLSTRFMDTYNPSKEFTIIDNSKNVANGIEKYFHLN